MKRNNEWYLKCKAGRGHYAPCCEGVLFLLSARAWRGPNPVFLCGVIVAITGLPTGVAGENGRNGKYISRFNPLQLDFSIGIGNRSLREGSGKH